MPLRAKVASSVSRTAAALSRAAGRGDGSVIGGWIGLKIDPDLLAHLSAGRAIALVSGTNGKTTTTRLTAAALGVLGPVATNSFGANMPTGHTSALAKAGNTPYAVLEVDEHYLAQVLEATEPHVVALLNLSRDQLDRAKEVSMMAQLWRTALVRHPELQVVANADDPMVVWAATPPEIAAAANTPSVTWFSAGQRWHDDSWVCPECGSPIERGRGPVVVHRLRPAPPRAAVDGRGRRRDRPVRRLAQGRCSSSPAGSTSATRPPRWPSPPSSAYDRPTRSPGSARSPRSPGGTPRSTATGATSGCCWRRTRPAGWRRSTWPTTRRPCSPSTPATPTGWTPRWLFDVDFAPLRGRQVLITGDRAYDLAVRLEVNEVPFRHVQTFTEAISAVPPGRLEVIANYTAFQDIRAELDRVN